MKSIFTFIFIFFNLISNAQVKGIVSDENGNPLPYVNIYIENTYIGTTSNEKGQYELQVQNKEQVTVIYQYLGYKTQKQILNITQFPYFLDVKLKEENYSLQEVVISSKENPAIPIIRKAIAAKTVNSDKTGKFTADFYSKGIFKLKNAPKKILGQEIGDMDGALDSTGSGIIYLSETVSKITYEKPNNLKEKIIASKISGNNNGFSYNTAQGTRFDFYDNVVELGTNMISPIADNAFNYYKYTLEGTFYDEHNQLINKIKVTPRRDVEPVFEGYIFIVEDSWAIYGIDLQTKGYRMKQEFVNTMSVTQNFSYNPISKIWAKNVQGLQFDAGAFGIVFSGKFTYVFSNYEFKESFEKKTFTREILSFEDQANKKDTSYWNTMRPVPLTEEESIDYLKKDSIQTLRKSKPYLDSIDRKNNKFKILKALTGYSYQNSEKNWRISYDGILKSIYFNTVQGWNVTSNITYNKRNEDERTFTSFGTRLNYGFAEDKFRATAFFTTRLNAKNFSTLSFRAGSQAVQFNQNQPISPLLNSVATLFFKENYMKLFEKNFINASYSQEVVNGFYTSVALEYAERKPLFDQTDYTLIKNKKAYLSNNPLDPTDFDNAAIEKHNLVKFNLNTRFNFGQKYLSRPDGKIPVSDDAYPTLYLGYEKGFAGNESNYNYDFVAGRIFYERSLSNKGNIALNVKGGTFFKADDISFVDYRHFNGNQINVSTDNRYVNQFLQLPYYAYSTNKSYMETHIEYDTEGYIMNKIPLLNKLKSTLILGYHQLAIPDVRPYQEFSVGLDKLGFGKFKLLRLDYVRSYSGSSYVGDGFMFGMQFLSVLE
ncbi:MAG: carboxypeptidase-like regulatory domain-containing protein [Flavobacteriales bacterium]|nr:carboxypeptidase-like regulatory domain-containing protein [Flavobacteriales bacterium]